MVRLKRPAGFFGGMERVLCFMANTDAEAGDGSAGMAHLGARPAPAMHDGLVVTLRRRHKRDSQRAGNAYTAMVQALVLRALHAALN